MEQTSSPNSTEKLPPEMPVWCLFLQVTLIISSEMGRKTSLSSDGLQVFPARFM